MTTSLHSLNAWVDSVRALTNPARVKFCTGSEEEYRELVKEMLQTRTLIELNPTTYPNSYLHRSDPNDVARTEHLTFICTKNKEEVGPNNNWMPPKDGHEKIDVFFKNAMQGRTMYVIPYCMGPIDSPYARCGVEITDSPYVVANMRTMTRMGDKALKKIEQEKVFVKGLHSTGDLKIEHRLIMHFPDELMIKSVGSGYGGNALLGKKCHALRIGSYQARQEGWLAEHMLIVGIENPQKEIHYVAAAFPSSCGKTNLAMLIPPEHFKGWKVWTVGDDIAWMHLGADGRLWATNPEAGYFGVAPGTSAKTNPNALAMLQHDTIFTNVALTQDNEPWWEGLNDQKPAIDWQGRAYDPANGPAAHPNSRFTAASTQCPSYTKEAESPTGVPISAIIFGGRRGKLIPLVYEAKSWNHGVFVGASVASETTAAATGKVGVLRHDPMAMQPFCGYNFADYWAHWLSFGKRSNNLPKVFHVNWFRQDDKGKFLWPGYGENLRVLSWIIDRAKGVGRAVRTPIGFVPERGAISTEGLPQVTQETMDTLCNVWPTGWKDEMDEMSSYFSQYGDRLPADLKEEHEQIVRELTN